MPKAHRTWTVLPHQPIEKVADNLWRVSGMLGQTQRQMVLARMGDGRVVVHNAIALDDAEMKEVEAWGKPSVVFVPNGYHRMDAGIWKERYRDAVVAAPAGARKKVEKVVKVDAVTEDAPGDDTVRLRPLDGIATESVLEVRSGGEVTLVFCDAILNMEQTKGLIGLLLAPTGQVSAPRIVRMLAIKDKRALAAQLDTLAGTPGLTRLMFGHGRPVTEDAPGELRRVAAQLRA